AGAAAGVVDAALVRFEHLDEEPDHVAGSVELAAALALAAGELGEEVLVDAAEHVVAVISGFGQGDVAEEVDELAEAQGAEWGPGVVLGEDAFEGRVLLLGGDHGVVDALADVGLLGVGLQVGPAGALGYPEDGFGEVAVAVLRGGLRVSPGSRRAWPRIGR